MDKLQMKYNFLHILYWITNCTIYGYVAVFLQYKGLSNTEIGLVTGGGAIASIFMSPVISELVYQIKGLTIKKLILISYLIMFGMFLLLTLVPLPTLVIMILYICLTFVVVSQVPLLSTICMDYLKSGQYINFGLSRGLGSASYAISAAVIGRLIEFLNPDIIGLVFIIFSILLLIDLFSMPDMQVEYTQKTKKTKIFSFIKKYRTFMIILLGFAFAFASAMSLGTYLINIVNNLGGTTSLYGIAIFVMASSEMPVMGITHSLLKKFKSETLLVVAIICYVLRNFTICLATNLIVLMIGMLFQGASYGLFTAVITYYVNDHINENDQMLGQTMIGIMTTGIGATIGNLFGGVLQDTSGLSSMYVFVCILTVLGMLIVLCVIRLNKIRFLKDGGEK